MKINVKGVIVPNDEKWIYDLFGIDATSPESVQEVLESADGSDVEVEINSGGGDVFSGSEIYTSLKDYSGNVTAKIVGLAASAASVVAMAADKLMMSPTSQMMIHNSSAIGRGDHRDMKQMSDVLKNVDKTIANAYQLKSGLADEKLLSMMGKETWLTPQEAVENGLADEVMFENDTPKVAASFKVNEMLPEEVINKVRNMKDQFTYDEPTDNQSDFLWAKLNLLKLRRDSDE